MLRPAVANRTNYWSDPCLAGVSLLCADFHHMQFRPHSHDAYVVAITETGGSVIRSRGDEFEVKRRRLMVFNPDEPHEGWLGRSDRWMYRSLYITRAATDLIAENLEVSSIPRFKSNGVDDPDLCRAFLDMHRFLERGGDPSCHRQSFLDAFCTLFDRHGDHTRKGRLAQSDEKLVCRAVELMEERYGEKLLLDDLASEIGLTSFQLIALFKRHTGLTPHSFLVQIRLRAACRLLRKGDSLAETSTAAGFYDQAAMTNQFRKTYAITPMQYARAWTL